MRAEKEEALHVKEVVKVALAPKYTHIYTRTKTHERRLDISLPVCLASLYLSVCLSFVCLSVSRLSVCLSLSVSVSLCVCLSVCLSPPPPPPT